MNTDTAGITRGRYDHHCGRFVQPEPDVVIIVCDISVKKAMELDLEAGARWAAKKMRKLGIPVTKTGHVKAGQLQWVDMSDMPVRRFVWSGTENEVHRADA